MKYIDAERLLVEIEKERKNALNAYKSTRRAYDLGGADYLAEVMLIIVQLQQEQPDVDLEKFISDFIDKKDSENQGKWCEEDIIEAMKSSFALGLNARKEE